MVDFHALRTTYITLVVKSGASVKEAQELARHSDPKLTMNVYTKLGIHDLTGALESMPAHEQEPSTDEVTMRLPSGLNSACQTFSVWPASTAVAWLATSGRRPIELL